MLRPAVLVCLILQFEFAALAQVGGQPYSAIETQEHTQVLADGTRISASVRVTHLYRDSQGRTRTEMDSPYTPEGITVQKMITIFDPVDGVQYMVSPERREAQRRYLSKRTTGKINSDQGSIAAIAVPGIVAQGALLQASPGDRPRPENKLEDLGTQTMQGVQVNGTRHTATFPVGSVGNDRPVVTVTESWSSRELGRIVYSHTSDPRMGETTIKLTEIDRAEPDPGLFLPPPDYKIIDVPGPQETKR